MRFDNLPTPCYVIDEARLLHNLEILKGLSDKTGCRILLAQKAFSCYALYPMIGKYLSGTTASGLYEARLGAEEMGGETHIFSAAYREDEFDEILSVCDHIVFNSCNQLKQFGKRAKAAGKEVGLRLNPECSTQEGHAIYDPCAPYSRLGVTRRNLQPELLDMLDGFHFHTLCEQDADALEKTLDAVEHSFGQWMSGKKWVNFGGGHHITRQGYDLELLERCIQRIQKKYQVQVYLEPGEAVALNAGYLVTSILDIIENGMKLAVLDTSAACHMPDVLEMPYRPPLQGAGQQGEYPYLYRLGGMTCLAGDVIADYTFPAPLRVGDRLVFDDMAIYTMVKNNTFNGMALPSIAIQRQDGGCQLLRRFGYEDFKARLS